MTIEEQILDVLENRGPKRSTDLIRILEDFDIRNAIGEIHPVKIAILKMLSSGKLRLSADRFLSIP